MKKNRTPHIIASLALVGLAWSCTDEPPAPAQSDLALTAAPEAAEPPALNATAFEGRMGRQGLRPMLEAITTFGEELGLSEEQMSTIDEKIEKGREEARSMKDGLRAQRGQMHALFKGEPLDIEGLGARHAEMQALRSNMQTRRIELSLDVVEILTPEQRAQLFALMKENMGKKGGCGCMSDCMGACNGDCSGGCKSGCRSQCKGECKGMKGRFGRGGEGMFLRALRILGDEIGQTPEQKERIESIMKQGRNDAQPIKAQMRALHGEMRGMFTAPVLDRAAIEAKHAEIMDLQKKMSASRFEIVLESLQVMTVEQRDQLTGILDECKTSKGGGTCKKLFKGKGRGKHSMHGPANASW
ncbi:MAG: periplasmic heavy metal sensor [Deltaproteobacteria bacterium]|nr:periplasmic heavy metal sensor [Deltaproteobacteria bacterium]